MQQQAPHLNGAVSERDLAISLDSALAGAINAPRPLASSASSWVVKASGEMSEAAQSRWQNDAVSRDR